MKHGNTAIEMPSVGGRLAALMAAAALAASCACVPAAFADEGATAGAPTGSGATDITIRLKGGSGETGGADTPGNPDTNEDGYGDNIAFSVPTSINFVANAQGVLTGPNNAAIQNLSKFSIHASSLDVDPVTGWNIVADASRSELTNAIDFQVGPANDMLDASAYLTKAAVSTPAEWNMAANNGSVALSTAGDINNVSANITSATKVATLHWYVTPGTAS